MVYMYSVMALASSLAAVFAALTWRATRRVGDDPDPALRQGFEQVRQSLSGLAQWIRNEQEQLRASQSQELAHVRSELHVGSRDLAQAQASALETMRSCQAHDLAALRGEVAQHLGGVQEHLVRAVQSLRDGLDQQSQQLAQTLRDTTGETIVAQRAAMAGLHEVLSRHSTEVMSRHDATRSELSEILGGNRQEQTQVLGDVRQATDRRLQEFAAVLTDQQSRTRREVTEALGRLQAGNEAELEKMRATVQEKLDATLGERLDASFRQVSERLETVHKGLGEMQVLANGVGSLQRTLTNVRTRGAWAELQLQALLTDLLTPEQYQRQVRVHPHSTELVDFAVRMPGGEDRPVWLPIDSKFPMDSYERLVSAFEDGDANAIRLGAKALTDRVTAEAASIKSKYICPPYTTDFAVLYLPTESLFAEVTRQPGLLNDLRTNHHIVVAGPTTLTALLGSLSLGFRTLAIQKRSSEAWHVLGQVKAEFEKSADVWDKVVKQLNTATSTAQQAGVRHRAISRSLRAVESAPPNAPLKGVLTDVEDASESSATQSLPLPRPPSP